MTGIELWNQPTDSVLSFGQQMGVTFPLLTQGSRTAQTYGADKNYIYLIDKNGTIQAIATIPGTSVTYAQIDSTVKSVADKIPALQNSAVRHNQGAKKLPLAERADIRTGGHVFDISGRRIRIDRAAATFMSVVIPNDNRQRLPAKVLITGKEYK